MPDHAVPSSPGALLARMNWQTRQVRGDGALIRAAQQGSERALEQLFQRHWPRLYRAAFLVVHDAAAAEDIAQEAFLGAMRSLSEFDRRRPLGPWLHRIAVNRAIDWSRSRTARAEVSALLPVDQSAIAPERVPELSDELLQALAELPADHRAVVVLRHLLEYTPGEIASMLELPRGTVNSRLRRALDTLAEALAEEGKP